MNGSMFADDTIESSHDQDSPEQNNLRQEESSIRTPELSGYIAP